MMMMSRKLVGTLGLSLVVAAAAVRGAEPDIRRLLDAIGRQDKAAVRTLIQQKVDVNASRADGVTPLLWAVHVNDAEITDMLLAAGAKINAAEDHGVTALAQACETANIVIVDKLLAAGADPNIAQSSGLTPLMLSVHTGNADIVKKLLAKGADPNRATTRTKDTALMWAIGEGRSEIARLLLSAGADARAFSAPGLSPIMFAARNGDIAIAKTLMAAGVGVNDLAPDGTHLLPYAIVSGQPQFALFLLDQGANPNGEMGGVRAIHAAAGSVGVWLSDWNRRHGGAGSLLGGAGFPGGSGRMTGPDRVNLVKALIAKGADPNARTTTSVVNPGYIGYPKKGAFESFATGIGDERGATAVWIAAYDSSTSGGNAAGGMGDAAAQAAAAQEAADAAQQAAAAQVPPQQGRGGRGGAPGAGGGRGGRGGAGFGMGGGDGVEIVRALVAGGANINLTTDDGSTPLMVAAGLGRSTFQPGLQRGRRSVSAEAMVSFLLDNGANIHTVNEADFQAIHGAAFAGNNEVIKILVDRGANINARDYRGRTPYRIAEGAKQSFQFQAFPETAEFIKKLGANTKLGIPGTVQERNRDLSAFAANQKP
jgi:ankyrin repeat protein